MDLKKIFKNAWYVIKNEPLMMLIVIFIVPFLFRFIVDFRVAALFAGTLFLLISVLTIRQGLLKKDLLLSALSIVFLILFVFPMIYLRLTHWEENFRALSFLGIPTTWLHENSKWIYSGVLILSLRQRYLSLASGAPQNLKLK